MTRNEFIENITEWWELKEFCSDNDCFVCEDIISEGEYDEYVSDDISADTTIIVSTARLITMDSTKMISRITKRASLNGETIGERGTKKRKKTEMRRQMSLIGSQLSQSKQMTRSRLSRMRISQSVTS